MNKATKPILVNHGPNCFSTAFRALLLSRYRNGSIISNRHLGFIYRNQDPRDSKSVAVFCSSIADVLQSIREVESIDFIINTFDDWIKAKQRLIDALDRNVPVLVFVDTFFLDFFPKEKGHTLHAMVVSQADLAKNKIFVSCSLPHQGMIDMDKLALARNSKMPSLWIKNACIEFNPPGNEPEISQRYFVSALESNVKALTGDGNSLVDGLLGLRGLRKFKEDFLFWSKSLEPEPLKSFLQMIFGQLIFVCDERKRYVQFLEEISVAINMDLSEAINTYKKVAYHWDIFRNLCFKISLAKEPDQKSLIERIDMVLSCEEKGLACLVSLTDEFGNSENRHRMTDKRTG